MDQRIGERRHTLVPRPAARTQSVDGQGLDPARSFLPVVLRSADGIVVLDADGGILFLNPAAERLLGRSAAELVGRPFGVPLLFGEAVELDVPQASGPPRVVEMRVVTTEWQGGFARLATLREITERKRAEEQLRESEERFELVVRATHDGIWDWRLDRGTVFYSPRWRALVGAREDGVGDGPAEWLARVHRDDLPDLEAALQDVLEGRATKLESEHRLAHEAGGHRWTLCRAVAVRDPGTGDVVRLVGSHSDVTARKAAEQRLRHEVVHDPLTGLPNRTQFLERLSRSLARSRRSPSYAFAVLFVDLDRFKVVNDSLGHDAGDRLLVHVARCLQGCVRPWDMVARLGGDEFVVLIDSIGQPRDALRIARRMEKELARAVEIGEDQEVLPRASIGIALSASRYEKAEDLLRDADRAMYRAKRRGGGGYQMFDPELAQEMRSTLTLENDLARAVERDELLLLYQPIFELRSGRLAAFESLVRWRHPRRGILQPAEFVELAEETGRIRDVDRWVVQEACAQLGRWREAYPARRDLQVSVNLSGKDLAQRSLVRDVRRALRRAHVPPRRLAVEVTESVFLEDTGPAAETLDDLRKLGVKLQLDDFGTGYSSLSYLHRFPVDALKVDHSFVRRMHAERDKAEIVKAIVSLARSLRLAVVAEGVEQVEQLHLLAELGCDYAQGFYFSKPVGAEEAGRMIAMSARR